MILGLGLTGDVCMTRVISATVTFDVLAGDVRELVVLQVVILWVVFPEAVALLEWVLVLWVS